MRKESTNTFNDGLISDLNSLTTPNSVLTYCKNGTFITFNGNELILQNDMGNTSLSDISTSSSKVQLSDGFVPIGIKEHGGIIYIISKNQFTNEIELGSFPSPIYPDINLYDSTSIEEDIIIGDPNIELTTNRINEIITLTENTLTPGDPFLISLDLADTTIDEVPNLPGVNTLSYAGVRKFYIPKLISITDNSNIDITNDVSGKIQKYTTDGENFINDNNNFWFLPKTLATDTTFQQYVDNKEVFYYSNRIPGKLGLKFELENIDLFKIIPDDKYGNSFPLVENIGDILTPHYILRFDSFVVEDPSSLKVNSISISYSIINNSDGSVYTSPTGNINDFGPFTTGISGNINNSPNPVFEIDLKDSKDKTITYTITPYNSEYDIIFTDYIITQTLDLSKSSLEWGLNPYYKLDVSENFEQKINPYTSNSTHTFDLATGYKDILKQRTPYPSLTNIFNNYSKILKNIKWFTKNNNLLFNINVNNQCTIYDVIFNGISSSKAYVTIKLNNSILYYDVPILIGDSGDPIPTTSNYTKLQYNYTSLTENVQLNQESKFVFNALGANTSAYFDGSFNMNTFKTEVDNLTGYTIYPQLNKTSSIGGYLSRNNSDGEITRNNNPNLLSNGNFSDGTFTGWTTLGSPGISSTTSSFKQYYAYWLTPSVGNKISTTTTCLSTKYYVLSFYAKTLSGSISVKGDFVGGSVIPQIVSGDWKLYKFNIQPLSDNLNLDIEITNVSGSGLYITNIELREKLNADLIDEPTQACITYKEDVIMITDNSNNSLFRHLGTYLPSSNFDMIDNFTLNSDFITNKSTSESLGYSLQSYNIRQ